MPLPVIVLRGAERDLEDIVDFIAEHDSAENARRVLRSLGETIERLATLPSPGNIPKELQALGITEFREAHFKPYRIVYQVDDGVVVVHCVMDGRRDVQRLLQRRLLGAP
ncbi:type II toxin-antitoxin system RelE/ParE family toxin [Inquilinus limosus]|uniref:type II toxin-antitoxin system RelE/ParE family toxin n=1 Tax=Inquilinus limosus TaxID=171674 RepID=UPI003F18AAAC